MKIEVSKAEFDLILDSLYRNIGYPKGSWKLFLKLQERKLDEHNRRKKGKDATSS